MSAPAKPANTDRRMAESCMVLAPRAGLYTRISEDAEGDRLGVMRQQADCTALVEQRGWQVAAVYEDDDRSAYTGKLRPAYERLLADLETCRLDAVVAWHPDRLHRSPRELEHFIDLIDRTHAQVATVTAGDWDLATASGRMQARMLGTIARYESEHKSERIRRKMRELAESGKVGGGGLRPFGFERDRQTHRPAEVELIREAARRVMAGESLYAVAMDWTARGVPTSTGAQWSTTAIKTFLIAPRVAGLRSHRGEVVGRAQWEPLLDERTWAHVRAVLTDAARSNQRASRSYLLTGLLRCGLCGYKLVATPRRRKSGGGRRGVSVYEGGATQRAYGCIKARGGCGGVYILAEPTEQFIVDAVLHRLAGPALARARQRLQHATVGEVDLLDQMAADEALLGDLGRDYAQRIVSRTAFLAAQSEVQRRMDQARHRLAEGPRDDSLAGVGDLSAEWSSLSIERQRAIIVTVLAKMSVGPAAHVRNRFDPTRISLTWLA